MMQTSIAVVIRMSSWNFRAAPGFFDVVTHDGGENIPHSLGTTPGMIIDKGLQGGSWWVWHKDIGDIDKMLFLEASDPATSGFGIHWHNKLPTENTFSSIGTNSVAYLFADTPGLIKCGD